MKIMNVTGWEVEGGFNGEKFFFAPYEEKEVWDLGVIKHLATSLGYKGIVHLVYNDEMKKKYKTYEEFKRAQILNGLKSIKKTYDEAVVNERQAMKELHNSNGAEFDKMSIDTKRFERKLEEIEGWMKTYLKDWEKADGSGNNKDKGQAKAG